jgi:AraC-like DNA-binding protein
MFVRSIDEADPLSDILRLADAETIVTGEFRATGPWSLRFPPPQGLKFLAVARGKATVRVEGSETITVGAGDVVLMNHNLPYVLASDLHVIPQDGQALFRALAPSHRVLVLGSGEETMLMGGHVRIHRDCGLSLAALLPPTLHIRSDNAQTDVMRWLLSQMLHERAAQHLGHHALTADLAHMLFVQVLRIYLSGEASGTSAWWRVLADTRLLPAIQRMHAEPGRAWQMEELAAAAAMSRTSFAVRFKSVSGMAPMAYLTRWRMLLAQNALRQDDRPMAAWIGELGYASESAFSHAFKRIVGMSPAQFRNQERSLRLLQQPAEEALY